jgi:hypothetical protein
MQQAPIKEWARMATGASTAPRYGSGTVGLAIVVPLKSSPDEKIVQRADTVAKSPISTAARPRIAEKAEM